MTARRVAWWVIIGAIVVVSLVITYRTVRAIVRMARSYYWPPR